MCQDVTILTPELPNYLKLKILIVSYVETLGILFCKEIIHKENSLEKFKFINSISLKILFGWPCSSVGISLTTNTKTIRSLEDNASDPMFKFVAHFYILRCIISILSKLNRNLDGIQSLCEKLHPMNLLRL